MILDHKVAIVIPIYKGSLTSNELLSLHRALAVFHSRSVVFIAPLGLDITIYDHIANERHTKYRFLFFPQKYFESLGGYNRLMLNSKIYLEFIIFDFILIYQLDAYVFKDELTSWCNRGFDFIGAPWINKENNNFKIEKYGGNGGFSLRRVSAFKKTLEINKGIVLNPKQIIKEYSGFGICFFIKKIPLIVARIFGYKNSTKFFIESNIQKEDLFWAYIAPAINKKFKVIKGIDAIDFAFEKYPFFLYKLNNYKLPFGCHAWTKHDSSFWRRFIQ